MRGAEISGYRKAIVDHYARVWRAPEALLKPDRGPIHELPGEFAIARFHRESGLVTHAT